MRDGGGGHAVTLAILTNIKTAVKSEELKPLLRRANTKYYYYYNNFTPKRVDNEVLNKRSIFNQLY